MDPYLVGAALVDAVCLDGSGIERLRQAFLESLKGFD